MDGKRWPKDIFRSWLSILEQIPNDRVIASTKSDAPYVIRHIL